MGRDWSFDTKAMVGVIILMLVFSGLFTAIGLVVGWKVDICIWILAIAMTAVMVLGVFLIVGD